MGSFLSIGEKSYILFSEPLVPAAPVPSQLHFTLIPVNFTHYKSGLSTHGKGEATRRWRRAELTVLP